MQFTPILIPELQNIVTLACGTNHVLALDTKGKVFVWGTGEQNQLGRRVVQRTARNALKPAEIGFKRKKITIIGSGDYHSFAVDDNDNVYSWGLNSFGQTGIAKAGANEDVVPAPTLVKGFENIKVKQIQGGSHHTLACAENGQVYVLGRVESGEGGFDTSLLPEDEAFKGPLGAVRYLKKPVAIPGMQGDVVSSANDTCMVIAPNGQAFTWGFNENYQTGQGGVNTVHGATLVDNSAVRGKKLIWGGVGGQFGLLGALPEKI